MAAIKIGTLILYAILLYVGITKPLTLGANISIGLLVVLALAHLAEMVIYRKRLVEAPGNTVWHFFNVFLFGVFHIQTLKAEEAGPVA